MAFYFRRSGRVLARPGCCRGGAVGGGGLSMGGGRGGDLRGVAALTLVECEGGVHLVQQPASLVQQPLHWCSSEELPMTVA